jgi:raffinose synthase
VAQVNLFGVPALLLLLLLQVWNINPVVGIVGVFNLQGSSWDRNRRKFHIHDSRSVKLATHVCPNDIEPFRDHQSPPAAAAAAGGSNDGSNGSSSKAEQQQQQRGGRFAVYRYGTEALRVCSGGEGVDVQLGKAGSDLVWISPLQQAAGVAFAPLGLVEMFNGCGSVLSCELLPGHQRAPSSPAAAAAAAVGGGPAAVAAMQVRGCGRFLAYSSAKPRAVLLNLTPYNFTWDEFTCRLEFEVPQHSEDLMCEVEVLYE